ncbi:MAG TPA: hypothetical protein VJ044_11515, partial [Candidatus Hodarchaeales archaeon]|nr:hypothetical protein [Candidatus Hodarchaeales archaeon]
TIEEKFRVKDPVLALLKAWANLLVLEQGAIDDIRRILQTTHEWVFICSLIEPEVYRLLAVYPNLINPVLTCTHAHPDFLSSAIKLNYAISSWIRGKDHPAVEELIVESLDSSRTLYLYHTLIKGYLSYAMYSSLDSEKDSAQNSTNNGVLPLDTLTEIKKLLFGMSEVKENQEFALFTRFLFKFLEDVKTIRSHDNNGISEPKDKNSPLLFFFYAYKAILSNDSKQTSRLLKLLRNTTACYLSSLLQRFYVLLAVQLKLRELSAPLDEEKALRFGNYIEFLSSEFHETEDEVLEVLIDVMRTIRTYKDKTSWELQLSPVTDLLTLHESVGVYRDIKSYFSTLSKSTFPIRPFAEEDYGVLLSFVHRIAIWTLISFCETSLPSYFLTSPQWRFDEKGTGEETEDDLEDWSVLNEGFSGSDDSD